MSVTVWPNYPASLSGEHTGVQTCPSTWWGPGGHRWWGDGGGGGGGRELNKVAGGHRSHTWCGDYSGELKLYTMT